MHYDVLQYEPTCIPLTASQLRVTKLKKLMTSELLKELSDAHWDIV